MAYVHHLVIHFPIAFATLSGLLAVYGLVRSSNEWVRAASVLTYLTALVAFVAAASGLLAAGHFVEGGGDASAVALHRNLALGATAVLLIAAVVSWRASRPGAPPGSRVAGGISILGAVVVSAAGHFGGEVLHPGMAPWSARPHTHGAMPGVTGSASAHADDGHEHGASPPSSGMPDPHAGMAMTDGGSSDASALDAASDAASPDHAAMPGMGSPPPAASKPAPPGHKNDHAH